MTIPGPVRSFGSRPKTLLSLALALLAAICIGGATADRASADVDGDPGWTESLPSTSSTGTINYALRWRCASASCIYTGGTTHLTAAALNGAEFNPGSNLSLIAFPSASPGKCNATSVAVDCLISADVTQRTNSFILSRQLTIPADLPTGTPIVELSWSDAGSVTGNDPANDVVKLLFVDNAFGDWGHERPVELRSAGTHTEGLHWTCLSEDCAYAPAMQLTVTASNGATFTDPAGTSLQLTREPKSPVKPTVFAGNCTVASQISLSCAPSGMVATSHGDRLSVEASYAVPDGLAVGTPILEIGWSDPEASGNDPVNDIRVIQAALSGLALHPPTEVFGERFENGELLAPTLITGYAGPPPLEQTYTADQPWLEKCNGLIVSELNPDDSLPSSLSACGQSASDPDGTLQDMREMAWLLGTLDPSSGVDPDVNHAVSAYTAGNPGAPFVQMQTEKPIPVTPNRFYAAGLSAVALHCATAAHPLMVFNLLDGAQAIAALRRPADPCAEPDVTVTLPQAGKEARAARFTGGEPLLFAGSQLGMQIVNTQATGAGNDGAVDNLLLLDVTPRLEKQFSPTSVAAGAPATLTFTVLNSTELSVKDGWGFTDTLAPGLTVAAGEPTVAGCGSASVTAAVGGRTISVADGRLDAGQEGCRIAVPVVADQGGTFQNCAANFSSVRGLELPACALLTVSHPPPASPATNGSNESKPKQKPRPKRKPRVNRKRPKLLVRKTASSASARPGSVLSYRIIVVNKGKGAARNVRVCDQTPSRQRTLRTTPRAGGQGGPCWRIRRLAAGAKRVFRMTAMVKPGSPRGVQRNRAKVTAANIRGVRADTAAVRVKPLPETACLSDAARSPWLPDIRFLC